MWCAGTSLALGLPCMSTNWANRNSMLSLADDSPDVVGVADVRRDLYEMLS